MKKIYFTHCSAKKDLSLKLSNKFVTPDKLYTATATQRFMNRCKENKVKWAIFSDKYGIWFNNTKNLWYEKDPNTITEQEFNILLDDFNSKLKKFDEIYFYHNPGRSMIEVGWRLAPEFWGKGYVTEAAEAWLAYGFETLGLDEIVSFAVDANRRSTAVMERLGMTADPTSDFDHPEIPDSHPGLKRHVFYRLSRRDWQARKKAAE